MQRYNLVYIAVFLSAFGRYTYKMFDKENRKFVQKDVFNRLLKFIKKKRFNLAAIFDFSFYRSSVILNIQKLLGRS